MGPNSRITREAGLHRLKNGGPPGYMKREALSNFSINPFVSSCGRCFKLPVLIRRGRFIGGARERFDVQETLLIGGQAVLTQLV